MAYDEPSTQSTGDLVTATIWNKIVNSILALRTGSLALASQAALDFVFASSATQLGRLAKGTARQMIRVNAAATAYEFFTDFTASISAKGLSSSPTPTIDTTPGGDTLVLADDATATMASLSAGLIAIHETVVSGEGALFFIAGGQSKLVEQTAAAWVTTNTDTKASVEVSGTTVTIRNRLGAEATFKWVAIKYA